MLTRSRLVASAAGLASLAMAAAPLVAQRTAAPEPTAAADTVVAAPGDRVRLAARTLLNPVLRGELAWLSQDSLALTYREGAQPLVLARADLTRLERSAGRPELRSRATTAAIVGAVVGGVIGLGLAERAGECVDCAPELTRARLGWGGGGAGVGALVGLLLAPIGLRETWTPAVLAAGGVR